LEGGWSIGNLPLLTRSVWLFAYQEMQLYFIFLQNPAGLGYRVR
jgi:hypothetical protein